MVGQYNQYTGTSTELASFALSSFSMDPSGHLLKFSQMNKLFSRFRFLFIQFGVLMNAFFDESAKKYDPQSIHSKKYIMEHSDGYRGKFNTEKAALTIFENSIINVIIYAVAWILKFQSYIILNISSSTQRITRL